MALGGEMRVKLRINVQKQQENESEFHWYRGRKIKSHSRHLSLYLEKAGG